MRIFASIIKRDDEKRLVYGYASTEALDSQGERVSKAAIEKALPDYMRFANIREMHQASAVGVAKEAEIDDKGLYLCAKVVDDDAWIKVKEGVYKGFSIGGKSMAKTDDTITELKLTEISLVDRPANPEAVIDVWKAEDVQTSAQPALKAEDRAAVEQLAALVNGGSISPAQLLALAEGAVSKRQFTAEQRKEMADKGHALPDGSFPIATTGDLKNAIKAFGRAKDKAKAKAHIIARAKALKATNLLPDDWKEKADGATTLRKSMYTVGVFAQLLDQIACIQASSTYEAEYEGDGSDMPERLKSWVSTGCEIFCDMADEESSELMGVMREPGQNAAPADKEVAEAAGDVAKLITVLRKAFPMTEGEPETTPEFARAELARRAASALEVHQNVIAKAGARFSKETKDKLATAHKHIKKAAGHLEKARGAPVAEADDHLEKCANCINKADEVMASTGYDTPDVPRKDADDDDESGSKGKQQAKVDDAGELLKAAINPVAAKIATLEGELANRDTTITALETRLKVLEAEPRAPKGPTRVVEKTGDNGTGEPGTQAIEPVRNADGTVDEAATVMKRAQALPTVVSSRQPSLWFTPRSNR